MNNLKDQHLMTREDLIHENMELRKYIDKLETKLSQKEDVFQEGTLTDIIDGYRAEDKIELNVPTIKKKTTNKKSLDDMMMQYRKYRKVFGEKPSSKEISVNLKMLLNQNE